MAGPIIVSGSGAVGVARTAIRRKLLRRLGGAGFPTTTAVAADGETTTAAIVGTFADDELDLEHLAGHFLYVGNGVEAGHQTRIRASGTHGALALLEYTRPTATVLGSGIRLEISAAMPSGELGTWPNANECIGDALVMLPIHHDVDFTFVAQQSRYDLSGLNWAFRRTDVLDIYGPIASGQTLAQTEARPINRGSWDVDYDGELPYIQFKGWGCSDGETFYVRMRRPASSWLSVDGVWGNAQGFVNDDDETVYDEDAVVNVALPIACERLEAYHRLMGDDGRAGYWAARREKHEGGSAVTRLLRGYRGDGRQRVGAVGGW